MAAHLVVMVAREDGLAQLEQFGAPRLAVRANDGGESHRVGVEEQAVAHWARVVKHRICRDEADDLLGYHLPVTRVGHLGGRGQRGW